MTCRTCGSEKVPAPDGSGWDWVCPSCEPKSLDGTVRQLIGCLVALAVAFVVGCLWMAWK